MLFADSAQVSLFPTITRCWTRIGVQPVIEAPGVRPQKRYDFGVVEPISGQVLFLTHRRRNNVGFRRLLAAIIRSYGLGLDAGDERELVLFVDNASEHQAKAVGRLLAPYRQLTLEFLPAYAPALNAQEDVWQEMRRQVTHNHYFGQMDALLEALGQFHKELETDPKRVVRLLKKWTAFIAS